MTGGRITLAHGSGGAMTHRLIADQFLNLGGPTDARDLEDAAVLALAEGTLAFTTDSYVVTPRFFPGGDIGKLAVCGTINDLAAMGAQPLAMSLALVIEEGFTEDELQRIMASVRETAQMAGVPIVTGDTKVVERGAADGLFVNTAGIGRRHPAARISARNARPGDRVILSGTVGDHGLAVLTARHELGGLVGPKSDCAPLWPLARDLLDAVGEHVHCLRDPTRGGVAATLNELAFQSQVGMRLSMPEDIVSAATHGACELLGLDPLVLANEGKLIAIVSPEAADAALAALRGNPLGAKAALVGEVVDGPPGRVTARTPLGTERMVDMPSGEILPRIC